MDLMLVLAHPTADWTGSPVSEVMMICCLSQSNRIESLFSLLILLFYFFIFVLDYLLDWQVTFLMPHSSTSYNTNLLVGLYCVKYASDAPLTRSTSRIWAGRKPAVGPPFQRVQMPIPYTHAHSHGVVAKALWMFHEVFPGCYISACDGCRFDLSEA